MEDKEFILYSVDFDMMSAFDAFLGLTASNELKLNIFYLNTLEST
ncbi:MAG: hypothetical protein ACXV8I_12500 [Methylobacter sp.]